MNKLLKEERAQLDFERQRLVDTTREVVKSGRVRHPYYSKCFDLLHRAKEQWAVVETKLGEVDQLEIEMRYSDIHRLKPTIQAELQKLSRTVANVLAAAHIVMEAPPEGPPRLCAQTYLSGIIAFLTGTAMYCFVWVWYDTFFASGDGHIDWGVAWVLAAVCVLVPSIRHRMLIRRHAEALRRYKEEVARWTRS